MAEIGLDGEGREGECDGLTETVSGEDWRLCCIGIVFGGGLITPR